VPGMYPIFGRSYAQTKGPRGIPDRELSRTETSAGRYQKVVVVFDATAFLGFQSAVPPRALAVEAVNRHTREYHHHPPRCGVQLNAASMQLICTAKFG